jgi:hypothetical protein
MFVAKLKYYGFIGKNGKHHNEICDQLGTNLEDDATPTKHTGS